MLRLLPVLALAAPALAADVALAPGEVGGGSSGTLAAPSLPTGSTGPVGQVWNGTTVPSGQFDAVAALYLNDSSATFCSGTLIHPSWVLTAAHCLADPEIEQYIADGVPVYAGFGRAAPYTSKVRVDQYAVHPSFDPGAPAGSGYDIGIVHLKDPVTTIAPIPYNTTRLDASFAGLPVTVIGFGVTGDGEDDAGTKRRADLFLFGVDGDLIYLFNGTLDRDGQPAEWDGTSNACQGDSGGASLAQDGSGAWVLVGVNDIVFPSCDHGGTGSTRTDSYASWIQAYTGGGGATTDISTPEAPDWFTLDATSGGQLRDPGLGDPARPDDAADYPRASVDTDTADDDGGQGCATVDGAGLLALTGLLARRRRRG